ncbi:hypothetical protein, partial [Streptomyces sp. NPDC047966]|uniref:hypothetical protein n=1 Tax=Streptomyces sp. NPDC047966 TaxID=3155745 RepID=UPI003430FE2E
MLRSDRARIGDGEPAVPAGPRRVRTRPSCGAGVPAAGPAADLVAPLRRLAHDTVAGRVTRIDDLGDT